MKIVGMMHAARPPPPLMPPPSMSPLMPPPPHTHIDRRWNEWDEVLQQARSGAMPEDVVRRLSKSRPSPASSAAPPQPEPQQEGELQPPLVGERRLSAVLHRQTSLRKQSRLKVRPGWVCVRHAGINKLPVRASQHASPVPSGTHDHRCRANAPAPALSAPSRPCPLPPLLSSPHGPCPAAAHGCVPPAVRPAPQSEGGAACAAGAPPKAAAAE